MPRRDKPKKATPRYSEDYLADIRIQLQAYRHAHDLAVLALAGAMDVPYKTLERFLDGKKTKNYDVPQYARFLAKKAKPVTGLRGDGTVDDGPSPAPSVPFRANQRRVQLLAILLAAVGSPRHSTPLRSAPLARGREP